MMRLAAALVLLLLTTLCALGNWGLNGSDVRLTGLRERPWIVVVDVSTNLASEPGCSFIVAFDRDQPAVRLGVEDEKFNCLSYGLLRGERIRRGMSRPQAAIYGIEPLWKKGRATVYYFSVSAKLLERSRLVWGFESKYKELGQGTATEDEWCRLSELAQLRVQREETDQRTSSGLPLLYRNAHYDLSFSLPAGWRGYTVLKDQWEATSYPPGKDDPVVTARGPVIVLRHPLWKADDRYQDIPVMVFTRKQWPDRESAVGAGGVIIELWHNRKYVFAMHSRCDFDDGVKAWDEVHQIVAQNCAAHAVKALAQRRKIAKAQRILIQSAVPQSQLTVIHYAG